MRNCGQRKEQSVSQGIRVAEYFHPFLYRPRVGIGAQRRLTNETEREQVTALWEFVSKLEKLNSVGYQISFIRNAEIDGFFCELSEFLLACEWPKRVTHRLPDFSLFLTIMATIERLVFLIEQPMTDDIAAEFDEIAERFDATTVSQASQPFKRVSCCLRFFSRLFKDTQIPFKPIVISIVPNYEEKDSVRFIDFGDLMPPLKQYGEFFS